MPRNKAKYYHLENIHLGYAEVVLHGKDGQEYYVGYVRTEEIPSVTDFEKDEIHTVTRWLAYDRWNGNINKPPIGRVTGYRTRIEAIEALLNRMKEEHIGERNATRRIFV